VAVVALAGFGAGTLAGGATGIAGAKLFDLTTAGASASAAAARSGSYGLLLSSAAANALARWTTDTFGTGKTAVALGFAFRAPSAVPTTDQHFVAIGTGTGRSLFFEFDTASGQLKLRMATVTPQSVLGPALEPDRWYWVELRYNVATTSYTADWSIDGAAQWSLTGSDAAASTITAVDLGWNTNFTYTAHLDDAVLGDAAADYPLGPHKVVLLSVDPAGTVTLSGTAANFNTFTANGTMAAWNATTARNNTDEVPPTIGASADGAAQITLQTTEYMQFPMTSYTLAVGETISGVRMLAPGWAATTTAATIGFRSWNGTTETVLQAGTVDPAFDASTTAPAWVCKMLTLADVNTQAELDALAFRVGFSSDATPDIGIHAVYAEVAVAAPPAGLPTLVMARPYGT
jgi:hypothetical protein